MDSHNLFASVKVLAAGAAIAAAANTNNLGNAIDLAGFDGVLFVVPIEDSAATGVATISAEQCDTSGGTYAALADDAVTATCVDADDLNQHFLVLDVFKPREQFVKLRRVSATANIAYGTAVAVLYNAHERPTALGDVLARAGVVSPAEG